MKKRTSDTKMEGTFPPPPVKASELLVPITTWSEMFRETEFTGIDFNEFWYDSVEDGMGLFLPLAGRASIHSSRRLELRKSNTH